MFHLRITDIMDMQSSSFLSSLSNILSAPDLCLFMSEAQCIYDNHANPPLINSVENDIFGTLAYYFCLLPIFWSSEVAS